MGNPVHHIELWTDDLAAVQPSFDWLLPRLGWAADHDPAWPEGKVWRHESDAYAVLEQWGFEIEIVVDPIVAPPESP